MARASANRGLSQSGLTVGHDERPLSFTASAFLPACDEEGEEEEVFRIVLDQGTVMSQYRVASLTEPPDRSFNSCRSLLTS